MNTLLCLCGALLLIVSTPAQASESSFAEFDFANSPASSQIHLSRNVRSVDIFDVTRAVIQVIINDLHNSASSTSQSVTSLTELLSNQTEEFLSNLNTSINNILGNVESAADKVLGDTENVTKAVIDCVNQQRVNASELVNSTLERVSNCGSSMVDDVTSILSKARALASAASSLADDIASRTSECGTANLSNLIHVGNCLNQIIVDFQKRADDLIEDAFVATSSAIVKVSGIPSNFVICSGTSLSTAALDVLSIVQKIGQCTISESS